jgi:hypothetical protein
LIFVIPIYFSIKFFNVTNFWFFDSFLIPIVAEKNILILVEEKKIIWFRVFVI